MLPKPDERLLDFAQQAHALRFSEKDNLIVEAKTLLTPRRREDMKRDLIRERTGAGRVAAKQRGVRFGRPEKMNAEQKLLAQRLLEEDKSVREIAKTFNVHKATIYRLKDSCCTLDAN